MRKVIVLISLVIFWGCSTVAYTEKVSLINESDIPDSTKAYFFGQFTRKSSGITDFSILFKNQKNETFSFQLNEESDFILIPMEPGEYSNDFGFYSWDVFYWLLLGNYEVYQDLKKPFIVKPGTIYYVGRFSSTGFMMKFEEDKNIINDKYPNFRDFPIVRAYNLNN